MAIEPATRQPTRSPTAAPSEPAAGQPNQRGVGCAEKSEPAGKQLAGPVRELERGLACIPGFDAPARQDLGVGGVGLLEAGVVFGGVDAETRLVDDRDTDADAVI